MFMMLASSYGSMNYDVKCTVSHVLVSNYMLNRHFIIVHIVQYYFVKHFE